MNSPDTARSVSVKQKENEDDQDLSKFQMLTVSWIYPVVVHLSLLVKVGIIADDTYFLSLTKKVKPL